MHTGKLLESRPWPFDLGMLTAGLRKKTKDLSLRIHEISEFPMALQLPAVGRLRGMEVVCEGEKGEQIFRLVVKEAHQVGNTRAATVSAGLRETLFYLQLGEQAPLVVPDFYAAGGDGSWLVLGYLDPGLNPHSWTAADYHLAVHNLTTLHDRFWGLGADLSIYPWLHKPLTSDFPLLVDIGRIAGEKLAEDGYLSRSFQPFESLLENLFSGVEDIAQELRTAPMCLIHGDYWPGNIHLAASGVQTVFDWQQVGIGPGILDLFRFMQNSLWKTGKLPVAADELAAVYRQDIKDATGKVWTDQEWQRLWDGVLLWEFLVNWLDVTTNTPRSLLEVTYPQEEALWLRPTWEAAERFFGMGRLGYE